MYRSYLILFCALSLNISTTWGQKFDVMSIPFTEFADNLDLAMAGGLTSPQFSEVDLNNDGRMDLYIFDKVGNVHLTFLNDGINNQVSYRYAPSYACDFPFLNNWALLRDFDGDGAMDIFSHSTIPGIFAVEVYKGYFEDNRLHFNKLSFSEGSFDILYYKQSSGSFTNLYVSNIDIPSIDDIDGDGDLDILTFSVAGGYLEFFKNESVEKGFGRDSLKFVFDDNCWGKFYESGVTPAVTLSSTQTICATNFRVPQVRHAGSTVLSFDEDGDGDVEVLLGDVSFANLVKLDNGGSNNFGYITGQDDAYPSYDISASINSFPAAYYLDVDNDGKKDLIAAPNTNNGENEEVGWFYKDVSNDNMKDFELQQQDFLVGEMVDLGSGAHPVFVDYNADGLQDLVVGNGGFFLPGGQRDARLFLYKNVGTTTQPAFQLEDANYLNFKQYSDLFHTFAPTFGDLDNDGDLDLLVGAFNGSLFFVENTAGPNNAFTFGPIQPDYMNIDVGQASKPQIADINKDGLPDLVIGERTGTINYIQNVGTTGSPLFNPILTESPNNNFFGGVDERGANIVTGFTAPFLLEIENDFLMLVGTEDRQVSVYSDIANNINTSFTKRDSAWGETRVGDRTIPAMADLNNDGKYEMILGNNRGGLSAFSTNMSLDGTVPVKNIAAQYEVNLWPNPARESIRLEWKHEVEEIEVFDLLGRSLIRLSPNDEQQQIDINDWETGIYIAVLKGGEGIVTKKFVVE